MRRDTRVAEKYHSGFIRTEHPSVVVIHGTGGGHTADSIIKWMLDGERAAQYKKGIALFHFLIDRTGDTVEIINPTRWVYHSSSGHFDAKTIGIELVNPATDNNGGYTPEQYRALETLVFDELLSRYPIVEIMSHNYAGAKYSNRPKACPGKNFSWLEIEGAMTARDILFTADPAGEHYSDIIRA